MLNHIAEEVTRANDGGGLVVNKSLNKLGGTNGSTQDIKALSGDFYFGEKRESSKIVVGNGDVGEKYRF